MAPRHIKAWWRMICRHVPYLFFPYPAHISWFKHLPWYRKKLPQHIWKKLKRWLLGLHNSTRPASDMDSPWGAHTSTQCQHKHFLARWFCLSPLVMLRAPEGGHQIVSGIKKKGADLLLNWPHWVDREYQVIELIHAVFPCPGKMICSIVCLLQLIKGKNVAGMRKDSSMLLQMCWWIVTISTLL